MRKNKILCLIMILTCFTAAFSACGNGNVIKRGGRHEAITVNMPYKNIDAFIDLVHEKHPEINLEIVPYSGQNTTAWMQAMLKSGELTDIYFTTIYDPANAKVDDKLLDISGYSFTDNFVQARLREVTVDGAVYMLPLMYNCFGVTYNKTLLDKNDWQLPKNLKEMEALRPKVEAAGYNFCMTLMQYPGYGFQYLCNILDADVLGTVDGLRWQSNYLNKKCRLSDSPKMLAAMSLLQRWKDIGLLNSDKSVISDTEDREFYKKGDTLFCLGNSIDLSKEDGATDDFKLMPYLSEDGKQNVFIMNVARYMGLNKHLTDKGSEQKLADALHVMELLSTEEGMWALNDQRGSALLPLKNTVIEPDSYYSDAISELNTGHTAPFIYSGWEDIIVPVGNKMLDFIKGDASLHDVIKCIDDSRDLLGKGETYTTVSKTLNTDDCARLVGIGLSKAVGADAALVSKGEYHRGEQTMNWNGVNGSLFPLPVTEQEIVSVLPTGWHGNIETLALTGARIKELAKLGYDMNGSGNAYPYELVTKEGESLNDKKTYTIVICGATDAVKAEGNLHDSGILGLDAMKNYLSGFKTLSKKDIIWR